MQEIADKTFQTGGQAAPWSDVPRIFLTCLLVYASFLNPWLQSSMTWNVLDAAVSFADRGRWELAHAELYEGKDTATADGRLVSAEPPGTAALILPFYIVWRTLVGPVDSLDAFQAFNGFLALVVGAPTSALIAVQVAWLAGWLGARRRGQLLAATLVAFGTQDFFFGTGLHKEGLAALAVMTAFRFAIEPGGLWKRALAGLVAGAATALMHQTSLLAALLLVLIGLREGLRNAATFVAGCTPIATALAAYNTWLFGKPWLTGYYFITGLSGLGFVPPKIAVLIDLLVGPPGGLFLYAPFLVCAVAGVVQAWQGERRGEALVTALFLVSLWLAAASWQSQFRDHASWAHSLGSRMMFAGVPLLASFAAPLLERVSRGPLLLVAVPSVACGYLSAQAGFIPTSNPFPYAVQTWISGTGMGVLFKEALPMWLGFETIHTRVSLPTVTYSDILVVLSTSEGFLLLRNQIVMLFANLSVLCLVGLAMRSLWRDVAFSEKRDDAGIAFSPSKTQR